jgi:hypothetical protein
MSLAIRINGTCRSETELRLVRWLLLAILILILANPLISFMDTTNSVLALSAAGMTVSLFRGVSLVRLQEVAFALGFSAIAIVLMLVGMIRAGGVMDAMYYVPRLAIWPLFWSVLFARYGPELVFGFIRQSYPIVIVVALLAYGQYFLSPTLWGWVNYESMSQQWASSMDYDEYSVFFRASSLIGSPQVLSVFCSLWASVFLMDKDLSFPSKAVGIGIVLGAGMLSGGKAGLLLILLLLGFLLVSSLFTRKLRLSRFPSVIAAILALVMASMYISKFTEQIPVIVRIFDIQGAIIQESNDSRIGRIVSIFSETNPLFGHGYTFRLFAEATGYRAAESYIAKLYFHFGFLPVLALLIVLIVGSCAAKGPHAKLIRAIIVMLFASMWLSTAFEATVLFPFWGVIVAGCFSYSRQYDGVGGSSVRAQELRNA